jgi:hypothetical protein
MHVGERDGIPFTAHVMVAGMGVGDVCLNQPPFFVAGAIEACG